MDQQPPANLIKEKLKQINFPGMDRDIVALGFIKNISVEAGKAEIIFAPSTKKPEHLQELEKQIKRLAASVDGVDLVEVNLKQPAGGKQNQKKQPEPEPVEGADEVIAVASGKGGVGKSTVAVNLACTLSEEGYKVGFADLDLYGPSAPTVFGVDRQPEVTEEEKIIPLDFEGLKVISIGFVLPSSQPTIWRGPMVGKGVEQLLGDVQWEGLDYLILDLPPGTGDTQITLCQKVEFTGAVLVTTPQELAVADVRRAINMFEKMDVDLLGIIENMSSYICPECGVENKIFGEGGGEELARELTVPFLGDIPLVEDIRRASDEGRPLVFQEPEGEVAQSFSAVAARLQKQVERK